MGVPGTERRTLATERLTKVLTLATDNGDRNCHMNMEASLHTKQKERACVPARGPFFRHSYFAAKNQLQKDIKSRQN